MFVNEKFYILEKNLGIIIQGGAIGNYAFLLNDQKNVFFPSDQIINLSNLTFSFWVQQIADGRKI